MNNQTTTHRLRVYVGPTIVRPMAAQFRLAGLDVTAEGTEHVYVAFVTMPTQAGDARLAFLDRLRSAFSHTFCLTWRDVQLLNA